MTIDEFVGELERDVDTVWQLSPNGNTLRTVPDRYCPIKWVARNRGLPDPFPNPSVGASGSGSLLGLSPIDVSAIMGASDGVRGYLRKRLLKACRLEAAA